MSNAIQPTTVQPELTPLRRLTGSSAGQFVRDNKVLAGGATVAGVVAIAGGAAKSDAFARVTEKGLIPAAGVAATALGAALVHDGVVNDLGTNNRKASVKIGAGTVLALGGTEVVGRSFDIPIARQAISKPAQLIARHGQTIGGGALIAAGVAGGTIAVDRIGKAANGERPIANGALGAGAALAGTAATLGGLEMIGRAHHVPVIDKALTGTVRTLVRSNAATTAAGVGLAAGAAALGTAAVRNFNRDGNAFVTTAEGLGAAAAGLGAVELIGHGLKVTSLQGALTRHLPQVGGAALAIAGATTIKESLADVGERGLRPLNAAGLAAGAAAVPGGAAILLHGAGFGAAAELAGRGAGVAGAAGLGVLSYTLGKQAVESGRDGKAGTAAVTAVGSAATAVGALALAGEATGIQALSSAARTVGNVTVKPVFNHVLKPAGEWIYRNPVAGGAIIAGAVGVGAYLHYRNKND